MVYFFFLFFGMSSIVSGILLGHCSCEQEWNVDTLKANLRPFNRFFIIIPEGDNFAFYQAVSEVFIKYDFSCSWEGKIALDMSINTLTTNENSIIFILEKVSNLNENSKFADAESPFYDVNEFIAWLLSVITETRVTPMSIPQNFYIDLTHRLGELDPTAIDDMGCIRIQMPRIYCARGKVKV